MSMKIIDALELIATKSHRDNLNFLTLFIVNQNPISFN